MKPIEQTIPFDALDLQKTIDANTARMLARLDLSCYWR